MKVEITQGFTEVTSWQEFLRAKPYLSAAEYIERIVTYARESGAASTFLGPVGPDKIVVHGTNYRESLLAHGLNPRCRAVLELVATEPWFQDMNARIYAARR